MSGGGSGTGKGPGAGKLFDSVTGLSENSRKMFQTKLDHWVGWFSGKGLGGLKELLRSPQAANRGTWSRSDALLAEVGLSL